MAAMVARREAEPDGTLHLHELAAVEEGVTVAGIGIAWTGDAPNKGGDAGSIALDRAGEMKPKIGLFGIGLAAYWPQFKGLKQRLERYQSLAAEPLGELCNVVDAGLID